MAARAKHLHNLCGDLRLRLRVPFLYMIVVSLDEPVANGMRKIGIPG